MKYIRQIIRGCGTLPYVGEHPGTLFFIMYIALGGLAGRDGGISGFIVGCAIVAVVLGPMYLYGAYSRAELSDKLSKQSTGA